MKEILKKDLLNIIQEENELDEMGQWSNFPLGGKRIYDPEMKKKFTKGIKGSLRDKEWKAAHVGWDLLDNPDNPENTPLKRIIFTKGIDIEEFKETHRDLLEKLKEEFEGDGGFYLTTDTLPFNWPYQKAGRIIVPLEGGEGIENTRKAYQHSGEKYSETENIRRVFNPIVKKCFNYDGELRPTFEQLSLPLLHLDDEHYTNRYLSDKVNNNEINLESHSLSSYRSAADFRKSAAERATEDELPEDLEYRESYYMSRLYNEIYSNNDPTKKNRVKYMGKTPKYGLEKQGFAPENLDITIMSNLAIHGQKNNDDTYTWVVKFSILFARKKPTEKSIEGGMQLLKDFELTKRTSYELPPNENDFSDSYTVVDNPSIKDCLITTLDDVAAQIKDYHPSEMLNVANYGISDIQREPQLNESIVERVVQNVIKEVMRKK